MPIKVSELELRTDLSEVMGTDEIIIIDPVNLELLKMKVAGFRGASTFFSENAPTDTPEDTTNFPAYYAGDIYYYDSPDGIIIYSRNTVDDIWEKQGFANGGRIWRSEQLTVSADDSLNESILTEYTNDLCFSGDFFFNPTREILYGPYDYDKGFNFSGEDYSTQSFLRTYETTEVQAVDTENEFTTVNSFILDTANNNYTLYSPREGDNVWVKKGEDNGHGGFVFTFYEADYNTSTASTHYEKVLDSFNANRSYKREPTVISCASQPTQDNNTYRAGDTVVDAENGVLYNDYVEDYENAVAIGALFSGSLSLKGKDLKYTTSDPEVNDSIYITGDFLFVSNKSTPRIHGPYTYGSADAFTAWPLYTVLRAPIEHITLATSPVIETFPSNTYPVDYNGDLIAEGDTWTKVYGGITNLADMTSSTKQGSLSDGAIIDYDAATINWGDGLTNKRPSTFWKQEADTQPVINDEVYYEGDYLITNSGIIYGPYEVDSSSNSEGWPYFTTIAASLTYHTLDVATTYSPATSNNSSEWDGSLITTGDTLIAYFADSTTGKTKEWYCTDIDTANLNAITWVEIKQDNKTHDYDDFGWPKYDDADYSEGDYIVNKSGLKFGPYEEFKSTDSSAWPYYNEVRSVTTYSTEGVDLTSDPTLPSMPTDVFGTFIQDLMFIKGDTLLYETVEGKIKGAVVTSINYEADSIGFGEFFNAAPTKTWNSNNTSQCVRDDNTYSAGDFIINANAVMYGPYKEYQDTDVESWPLKASLRDNIGVLVDTGSVDAGVNWKLFVENGILQIEEL